MMKCPWTGRVFTNAALYRQHIRTWPDVAKVNGLNLDGSPATGMREQPETGLDNAPDGLDNSEAADPHQEEPGMLAALLTDGPRDAKISDALAAEGFVHLHQVRDLSDDELRAIPGIGPASVTRLREVAGDG